MLQHVFVSYRQESLEHARAVRRLGELLRMAKIPVALDQFYLEEYPAGPDSGGWPKWCAECAKESSCVLVIGSEGWFAEFEDDGSTGGGFGAAEEARLFRQFLWDGKGNNPRIRLAFMDRISDDKIPEELRAWHRFRLFESDCDDQLNELIRWVSKRLDLQDIELPTVSWPEPLPFDPDLADRKDIEWPAIVELMTGRSRHRILMYEGASGLGKSVLVKQAAAYARNLGVPVVDLDFEGGGLNLAAIIDRFNIDLGLRLPNFSRERRAHLLRDELRRLRRPVLVVFDSYEHAAGNRTVADWLNQQLLTDVETALGLVVIIAGERMPDYEETGWKDLVNHLILEPITQVEHWKPWIERHFPNFLTKGGDLSRLLTLAEGNPAVVSSACEAIANG